MTAVRTANATTVTAVACRTARRCWLRRSCRRSSSFALGVQSLTRVTCCSLQDRDVDLVREPLLLQLGQRAVRGHGGERLVDAGDQRVALLEEHPELLLLAADRL